MQKRIIWVIPALLIMGIIFIAMGMNPAPMEEEKEVSLSEVPPQVKEIILKEAGNHPITEIEATTRGGVDYYEAEWLVGDMEQEVHVVYACKLFRRVLEPADGDKGDDEDEDEIIEYQEKDTTLDQVSGPVKAAILKQAGQNSIEEVEEIITSKGSYYEAEWTIDGWEVEVLVDADGKLVRRVEEVMHDDDDEDEDDDDDDYDD